MKTRMYWLFLRMIVILTVISGSLLAQENTQEESIPVSALLGWTFNEFSVKNIPFDIRNVPIHPDDFGRQTHPGAIGQTDYSIQGFIASLRGYFLELSISDVKVRPGMRLDFIFESDFSDIFAQRNYTNAPGTEKRGYGAALTYISLQKRGLPLKINLSTREKMDKRIPMTGMTFRPEVTFKKPLTNIKGNPLNLIGSVGYYHLQIETGWDRYDRYETYKRYNLGSCFPVTFGLTLIEGIFDLFNFNIEAGYTFVLLDDFARDADVSNNWNVKLSFSTPY